MSSAALPKPVQARPPPSDIETRIEELTALSYVILSRLAQVEETAAVLAERAGLTARPVVDSEWSTVKKAAHSLGCSASNVYRLIRLRVLTAEKHAGRVL